MPKLVPSKRISANHRKTTGRCIAKGQVYGTDIKRPMISAVFSPVLVTRSAATGTYTKDSRLGEACFKFANVSPTIMITTCG